MAPPDSPPLVVEDVCVDYGGLRALDGVSLDVAAGSVTGLIGPNGAGKTTLFDCVSGLVRPVRGRIVLLGRDVTHLPPHERASLGLGRTFQRLELFGSLTVEENLVVALEARSRVGGIAAEMLRRPASLDVRTRAERRAQELLELVGLEEHARTRAADLPMGLARLLEVARAVAIEPKLLLLDEPSSGLNDEETARLAGVLHTLLQGGGLTLFVVEHDMDFVLGISETVWVLEFGRIIASGTPVEVRANPAVRAAYLGEELPDAASP